MNKYPVITAGISRSEKIVMILVLVIYSVGITGISISSYRDIFISLIPAVILLSLAGMLAFHRTGTDLRTITVFSAIIIVAWLVEAAGVATGIIFGNYVYGSALGWKLLNTPVIIGFNWLLLVYGSAALTRDLKAGPGIKIVLASALMVIYDIVLELAAPRLLMWQFTGEGVPLRNYIAWFLIAALFHYALYVTGIKIRNRVASFIFVIQCLFFMVLAIIFHINR